MVDEPQDTSKIETCFIWKLCYPKTYTQIKSQSSCHTKNIEFFIYQELYYVFYIYDLNFP